jgi:hypothetical protein
MYQRLQDLWSVLTDSINVFDVNGSVQLLCAQKVWEALLATFPFQQKHMQTDLLDCEISYMILWDSESKHDVNPHFGNITELSSTTGYIGRLSIQDVLKSVLMDTLRQGFC